MLALDNPVAISCQEYPFALALGLRFYNECFRPLIVELLFEAL